MYYKRPAPNYRSLLANASQSPTLKKEAPPEHQKDPPLVTYDAIRERATSESASPPDSTKPNGATQKKETGRQVPGYHLETQSDEASVTLIGLLKLSQNISSGVLAVSLTYRKE